MNHSSNNCKDLNYLKYNSSVIEEKESCNSSITNKDLTSISKYLIKVGAASALSLSICSVDYNSFNFHYSESIILQETSKIGISNYLIDQPIIDNISVDHEIAFHTTQMENLNPVQPNKSIRITGRVIKISRGEISKV